MAEPAPAELVPAAAEAPAQASAPAEDAAPPPPPAVPPPEQAPIADPSQLMRDIFGDSDEEEAPLPKAAEESDEEDAEEDRNKAASRLEGAKKAKRQKSEDKPKRQRKTDKEPKKKKRAEASVDAEAPAAAGAPGDSDEEKYTGKARAPREMSDFDRVVDSLKRGHRRKRDDAADDAARAAVKELLMKMQNAAQSDIDAAAKDMPATHKLKLLPDAIAAVNKAHLQPFFLPEILPVITTWLTPTADGSLPNLSVREGMLSILKQLQGIDTESLKSSGVGKAVMAIYKHPNEITKNKKIAQELIERWSRPLFQLTDSYRDMRETGEEEAPRRRLVKTPAGESTNPLDQYVQAKKNVKPRVRASIPNRDPLDFTKQPRSYREMQGDNVEPLPALPPSLQFKVSKTTKFADKFNSKGTTKSPHFVKMSVEGRGFGQ